MLSEHATVIANRRISYVIPKGSIGTVVHVYENINTYEVEFTVNDTSIVETVSGYQIDEYSKEENTNAK